VCLCLAAESKSAVVVRDTREYRLMREELKARAYNSTRQDGAFILSADTGVDGMIYPPLKARQVHRDTEEVSRAHPLSPQAVLF
jgi:polysaccharide pyruvyl transferase WcaK-like protein